MSAKNARRLLITLAVGGTLMASAALAEDCGRPGDSPGRFGPYDYRDRARLPAEISVVERHHFTSYMEEMALFGFASRQAVVIEEQKGGKELIGGNLDYTLYAFPNHHPALNAMGAWQLRLRQTTGKPPEIIAREEGVRTAECYFERAVMMAANDGVVHLAYGVFLHKAGNLNKALEHYLLAVELMPDSPEAAYNLGLARFDRREYEQAAAQAARAYGMGYPLQGLKNKLRGVGVAIPSNP